MDPLTHKEEKDTAFMKEEEEEEEEDEEEEDEEEEDDSETIVLVVEEESDDKAKGNEAQQQKKQAWAPTTYSKFGKEVFCYVGEEISIFESLDSYGAVIWPAALALCHYLETNVEQFNLVDKAVLELGAGPGLLSIVATLLGAWVTATDLPEIVGNLRANLLRNTRGRCRYTPQAAALSWGPDVERTYPRSIYRYDYVLAADVVYHHDYREELLLTMRHFCRPGTTLIWANKVRLKTDLNFTENFKNSFNTTLLAEMGEVNIFMATCRETEEEPELQKEDELEEEEEEPVTECVQEDENGLEEEEEEVEAVDTTENEEEDETQKEGLKQDEENKDRENQEDSEECRDDEEQNSAGSGSTSESELEGLDTQDSNVQQEERPVWVEQFVVESDTQDSNVQQEERPVWVEQFVVESDTQDSNVQQEERPVWVEQFVVESDTQDSNVQQEERPVWVEQFVVESDKRSEEQDNISEEAEAGDGSSQAWEEQWLKHSDEGYEDEDEAENSNFCCSTEVTDEDIIEELDTKETKDTGDAQLDNTHVPWIRLDREVYFYAGHKINIVEAMDSYGGVIWPAALALCNYLETNTDVIDLKGKQVLELGSGTGLVSIVACLLGAQVTATDLPDILSNLRYNLLRNTRGRSIYTPEVTALSWGPEVERTYPRSIYHYDYVLAADVVHLHDLEELLLTMKYFCRPGTTLIWANKVRLKTNLEFIEDVKNAFNTTLLAEMGEVKIFKATYKRLGLGKDV